jgi:hypothetical protein
VPLQPDDDVERKVGLLLNPAFVNEFIYGRLIYGPRSNSWGFVSANEIREQIRPATRVEQNAIIATLESHQVVIACRRDDGIEGYLVPDRFEMRPRNEFTPKPDSIVRYIWEAENFVPEHALFSLMARYRKELEPIDRQGAEIKTYAHRNACLFKRCDTEVQAYLNVLTRKLYMCGKGEGAETFILELFSQFDRDGVHGWRHTMRPWRLRSEIQKQAIAKLDKLVSDASGARDGWKRIDTQEAYRKGYQVILKYLNSEENGERAKRTDDEIATACDVLGKRAYVAERRKELTDAKLLEQDGATRRAKYYSLSEHGNALLECMDEDGNAKVGRMPMFDPDEDTGAHTMPALRKTT